MAYRVITDDVPISTSLNQLSHFGERLYFRLLSQTDSWGRLPGELVKIRDLCIPRLAVTDSELAAALEELVIAGRLTLYCNAGTWACQIIDFDRHQPIANLKRGRSRWPEPPQTTATAPAPQTANGRDIPTDISDNDIGTAVEKSLQKQRSLKTETEDSRRDLSGSPRTVVSYEGLPDFTSGTTSEPVQDERMRVGKFDLREISRALRGADAGTAVALSTVMRGMPEAALACALEGLDLRRGKRHLGPIRNEARWLVGTINTMRAEGQYATSGGR